MRKERENRTVEIGERREERGEGRKRHRSEKLSKTCLDTVIVGSAK